MSADEKSKWGKVVSVAEELEGKWDSGRNQDFKELMCCCDCGNLRGFITKYGNKHAICAEFEIELNCIDPIERCTSYYKRNSLSIHDMKEMAMMIEVKRGVGFTAEE